MSYLFGDRQPTPRQIQGLVGEGRTFAHLHRRHNLSTMLSEPNLDDCTESVLQGYLYSQSVDNVSETSRRLTDVLFWPVNTQSLSCNFELASCVAKRHERQNPNKDTNSLTLRAVSYAPYVSLILK